jgi:dinuclear metal center YbgI/SA1388 family protein
MDEDLGLVAVAHEITNEVVEQVLTAGVSTLVSYHPLLFDPVTSVVAGPTPSGRAMRLLRAGVSLLVVHTAMDVAPGGTGDALLSLLGVQTEGSFADADDMPETEIGRVGRLGVPTTAGLFAELVAQRLSTPVQIAGDPRTPVETVATVPGSGSSFIAEAAALADLYITGDVSHHSARSAIDHDLVVLDPGHAPTERPGVEHLYDSVCDVVSDAVLIASDPHPWEDVSWKT